MLAFSIFSYSLNMHQIVKKYFLVSLIIIFGVSALITLFVGLIIKPTKCLVLSQNDTYIRIKYISCKHSKISDMHCYNNCDKYQDGQSIDCWEIKYPVCKIQLYGADLYYFGFAIFLLIVCAIIIYLSKHMQPATIYS